MRRSGVLRNSRCLNGWSRVFSPWHLALWFPPILVMTTKIVPWYLFPHAAWQKSALTETHTSGGQKPCMSSVTEARPAFKENIFYKNRHNVGVVVELYNTWGTLVLTAERAFNLLSSWSEATLKWFFIGQSSFIRVGRAKTPSMFVS